MNQDTMGGGGVGSTSSQPQPTGMKEELASDAMDIGKAARERLDSKAGEGKEQATQAARSTSSALEKAAEQLRQDEEHPTGWPRLSKSPLARSTGSPATSKARTCRRSGAIFRASRAAVP